MSRLKPPTEERFWSRVDLLGDCWEWRGSMSGVDGYGAFRVDGGTVLAHRWSLEQHRGFPLGKLYALHHCDNPPCVRPEHLYAGTQKDNMEDAAERGRMNPNPRRGEEAGNARLTWEIVREVRRLYREGEITQRETGERMGIHWAHVNKIVLNKCWVEENSNA